MIDRMLLPWSAYEAIIKPGNRAFKVLPSRLMNDQPPSNFFPLAVTLFLPSPFAATHHRYPNSLWKRAQKVGG